MIQFHFHCGHRCNAFSQTTQNIRFWDNFHKISLRIDYYTSIVAIHPHISYHWKKVKWAIPVISSHFHISPFPLFISIHFSFLCFYLQDWCSMQKKKIICWLIFQFVHRHAFFALFFLELTSIDFDIDWAYSLHIFSHWASRSTCGGDIQENQITLKVNCVKINIELHEFKNTQKENSIKLLVFIRKKWNSLQIQVKRSNLKKITRNFIHSIFVSSFLLFL